MIGETAINIAGARRSLLTLWPVDDAGTAEFMVAFYRYLSAGKTYAKALPNAKLEIVKASGHCVDMEQPEALAKLVTNFIGRE